MNPFALNVSTIFTEYSFLDRFKKAKNAGFSYVECQFPYDHSIEKIQYELLKHKLSLVLINLPPGDWKNGERGLAIYPERVEEFQKSVDKGIRYATKLGVSKIHCMAGILPLDLEKQVARQTFIRNLKHATEKMEKYQLTLVIEPINRLDIPGYFLSDINEAIHIIKEVEATNLKLQYDFYHIQRIHGEVVSLFEQYYDRIAHVQIADVPGRHQPYTGDMKYNQVFKIMRDLKYQGFIGLEYIPKGSSEDSFDWLTRLK